MNSDEIRTKFLDFFKARSHAVVPSSSLIPDDPSVLLTTAGMQQFKRYFTGELDPVKSFGSKNTVSIQKSFRTSDIDEVGDETHLTFFEMLGNFSFGGYFKDKAIEYGYEFITKEMGLAVDYVTVFDPAEVPEGDWRKGVPFDEESYKLWQKFVPKEKIRRAGIDNFWGPTGNEGPCGPTTEIYVRGVEIWNIVFNQFHRDSMNRLTPLKIQGVDTGMGLERLAMVSQNVPTIFETDLFASIFDMLEKLVGKAQDAYAIRFQRIVADHIRGITFLLSDGVVPSNKETGYVLRRLIRRAHTTLGHIQRFTPIANVNLRPLARILIDSYGGTYPELKDEEKIILDELDQEQKRFQETKDKAEKEAIRIFHKWHTKLGVSVGPRIGLGPIVDAPPESGDDAFYLESSHGFHYEAFKDLAELWGFKNLNRSKYEEAKQKHQTISGVGQEKKFGGHGLILDTGELKAGNEEELKKVLRLHTATHLLQAALRKVLGLEVQQRGSDITPERTRFDFSFPRKLTPEEIKNVEALVNEKIKEDLPVSFQEMSKAEAEKTGALYFFKEKYPERVKVYYVGRTLEDAWSKEFCGGPHVTHTGEIGSFRIAREEAVGAGIRRIRAMAA